LVMNDSSGTMGALKAVPTTTGGEYPMKELADKMRIPSIKASFALVKNLVSMIADGKIVEKMTNFHVIIFPSKFTLGIWSCLHEILGKNLAPRVITSFHRDTGRTIVQVGKRAFKLEDKYAFEFYFWLISAIGWGEIKKFEFDAQKMEGTWQIEYKGSMPKNAPKDIPLHDNFRGEIIAAADEAFHVPIEVNETKCIAMGNPFCEFKWKKTETSDKGPEKVPVAGFEEAKKTTVTAQPETVTLKNDFKEATNMTTMNEEGKMLYGDIQVATKDVQSIVGLTYRASEALGEGTVRAVFVRTGKLFADEDVKRYNSKGRQLVDEYLKFMAIGGWGMFRVANLNESGGEVTCEHSAFAEDYPRGDKTVCYFVVGILSALMEQAFGRRYMVKEVECIAKGNEKCRFEIRAMPK
jgi:predicted hydrocarbon binding protein